MSGFADMINNDIANLASAILNAPTQLIQAGTSAGSGIITDSGGFFGGLFNRGTGASLASGGGFAGVAAPSTADLKIQYGGGETFFSRNKGLIIVLAIIAFGAFVLNAIFGKKKKGKR